jgi:hypothetical protein
MGFSSAARIHGVAVLKPGSRNAAAERLVLGLTVAKKREQGSRTPSGALTVWRGDPYNMSLS